MLKKVIKVFSSFWVRMVTDKCGRCILAIIHGYLNETCETTLHSSATVRIWIPFTWHCLCKSLQMFVIIDDSETQGMTTGLTLKWLLHFFSSCPLVLQVFYICLLLRQLKVYFVIATQTAQVAWLISIVLGGQLGQCSNKQIQPEVIIYLLLHGCGTVSHCPLALHDTVSNHCCVELSTWPARHWYVATPG